MSVDVVVTTMSYLICEHNYCTMFTSTIITYYIIACSQHHQDKVDRTTEMVSLHSTSHCLVSRVPALYVSLGAPRCLCTQHLTPPRQFSI